MKEAAQGILTLIGWIVLIYLAYKFLDVTGIGNLIGDFFDWMDTTPPDYCGVCDPPSNF